MSHGRCRLLLVALLLPAACAYTPPTTDPIEALQVAEVMLQEGRPADAARLLGHIGEDAYEGAALERWKARRARALLESGDWWPAFRVTRAFLDDHKFSLYEPEVEAVEFEAGKRLIQSTWSFWIFANDADEGIAVLDHFVSRYPNSRFKADALHLLGNKMFQEEEYQRALEYYKQLWFGHRDSEWAQLALFRIAISRFHALFGPEYDFEELRLTRNELAGYLAGAPENPRFVAEAQAALAQVRTWIAERHVLIADFYRRVGNETGELRHLGEASADYPDTAAGQEARARLAAR